MNGLMVQTVFFGSPKRIKNILWLSKQNCNLIFTKIKV